jgi:hypothetical protein
MSRQRGLIFFITLLIASGCSTESRKETLGGVATVSAIGAAAVLMPVIPFTLGYNVIEAGKERRSDKQLYKQLDPVYKKRIEMIKERSPKADVAVVWSEGARAFLPLETNAIYHPGLGPEEYRLDLVELKQETNQSPLFTYLQTLLETDPLQKEVKVWNQTFTDFLHARGEYEAAFNQEMYRRMKAEKTEPQRAQTK